MFNIIRPEKGVVITGFKTYKDAITAISNRDGEWGCYPADLKLVNDKEYRYKPADICSRRKAKLESLQGYWYFTYRPDWKKRLTIYYSDSKDTLLKFHSIAHRNLPGLRSTIKLVDSTSFTEANPVIVKVPSTITFKVKPVFKVTFTLQSMGWSYTLEGTTSCADVVVKGKNLVSTLFPTKSMAVEWVQWTGDSIK